MCFNILWHLEVPPKSSWVSEEGRKRRTKKPVEGGEHGEWGGGGGGGGGEVGRGVGGERGVRGVRISRGIPSGHRVPIRPKPIMSIYFSLGRHQSLPGWSPGTSGVNIIPENSKRWNIGSRPPPCFHLHKHCEPAEAISRLQDCFKFTFGPGIAPPVADWMYLEVSEFLREPAPGGKDDDDHGDDADIGDDHIDDAPGGKDNDDYYDDGDGYDEPGGNDNDDDGDHQACTWWRNSEGVTSSSWTSRRQKVVGLQPWIIFNRADHLEVILKPPWVRCWVASLSFWRPVLSSLRTPSVGSQWFLFLPVQCLSYKWKNQFGQGPQSVFFAIHENPRSSAFSGVFSLFKATLFLPHIGAVLQEVLASSQRFFPFTQLWVMVIWAQILPSTHYIWNEVINCWRFLPDWMLKWGQNWKLPILESHKSDGSRSIRNYQGRKQITPLSPNSFSTNVLFSRQNGDICGTPGIWQERLEAFQSWSILWRRSRLKLCPSWIIKHFVCTLHGGGPQKCNTGLNCIKLK